MSKRKVQNEINKIEKKGWKILFIFIFIIIAFGMFLYYLSKDDDMMMLLNRLTVGDRTFTTLIKEANSLDIFFQWVTMMSSFASAAIIFYYTIMEQAQHGIPNRKIVAYSLGSVVVPGLFAFVLLVGIPLLVLASMLNQARFAIIIGILLYLVDVTLLLICILSSMRFFCMRVIKHIEHKQFENFFLNDDHYKEIGVQQDDLKKEYKIVDSFENKIFYHIELLASNNELKTERFKTICEILKTPYWTGGGIIFPMDYGRAERESSRAIYQYLYDNITIFIEKTFLRKDMKDNEVDQIYSIFYEYIRALNEWYDDLKQPIRHNPDANPDPNANLDFDSDHINEIDAYNYIAAWTAILGAVVTHSMEKKEEFCKYVMNCLIYNETIDNKKVKYLNNLNTSIYIAYLEYLYVTRNHDNLDMLIHQVSQLHYLDKWKRETKDLKYIAHFWEIWFSNSTFPEEAKRLAFGRFRICFLEEEYDSPVMTYINITMGKRELV